MSDLPGMGNPVTGYPAEFPEPTIELLVGMKQDGRKVVFRWEVFRTGGGRFERTGRHREVVIDLDGGST
jgi:hypothetical protein